MLRAIARGARPQLDWAVSTVKDAKSYTGDEALAAGAIDVKADALEEASRSPMAGRSPSTVSPSTLASAGAPTTRCCR